MMKKMKVRMYAYFLDPYQSSTQTFLYRLRLNKGEYNTSIDDRLQCITSRHVYNSRSMSILIQSSLDKAKLPLVST